LVAERNIQLLRAAGLLAWAVVGAPRLVAQVRQGWPRAADLLWFAAYVLFAVAFIFCTRDGQRATRQNVLSLLVQALAGLATVALSHASTLASALLVVVAGQLPFFVGGRVALAWVAVQTVVLVGVLLPGGSLLSAAVNGLIFATFQLFALGAAQLAVSESLAREELARVNAELTALQALLAESARIGERLRISRELHDSLGHALTALSLQLEVASHLAEGRANEHVAQAREQAKKLMADLRAAVSALREGAALDLRPALAALAGSVSRPRVHLAIPEDIGLHDAARAHALFRCVQEIVTNAVRHARAENLWIGLERDRGVLMLKARDDGAGASALAAGHGLIGMRERLEELGGRLEVETGDARGFAVRVFLPVPGAAP
jgi:signal transduction histidine kinase